MKRRSTFLVVATLLLTAAPLVAQGPTRTTPMLRWGPQISFNTDASKVGIGARVEHSLTNLLGGTAIDGIGEANFFPGSVSLFDFDYDVVYRFSAPSVTPYLGGGLNFLIASGGGHTASDLHLNALGGLRFLPLGKVTPVLQLRYIFAGAGDALIITGGILF